MFDLLKNNIIDCIKEQQLKLGYLKAPTRLYYMLDSLNLMDGTNLNTKEMLEKLEKFSKENEIGEIQVSVKNNRFCLFLSDKWSEYIHDNVKDSDFIIELINLSSRDNIKIADIVETFERYNSQIHIEKMDNEDFDYLIYFANGIPDNYRYCFHLEGERIIYHRYAPWDYNSFGFGKGKEISSCDL